MKRIVSVLLFLVGIATTMSAQDNKWRLISASVDDVFGSGEIIYTSGKKLNNHLFYGLGSGISNVDATTKVIINDKEEWIGVGGVNIPVFGDVKLRVFDSPFSPYLRLRAGVQGYIIFDKGLGLFVVPEIGLDLYRGISFSLAYNFINQYSLLNNSSRSNAWVDIQYISFGLCYEFDGSRN